MKGIFTAKYQDLTGKDWVRRIEAEDRAVFVDLGLQALDHGKMGGEARSAQARRDGRGRFARNCDGGNVRTDHPELDITRGQEIANLENQIPF